MSQWFRSRRSPMRSPGGRARRGVFRRLSPPASGSGLRLEPLEARRLLTVAATLAGTDLTVQITGADTATIIENGGDVQVLDSSDTNQLAAVIPAASLTSITVTPDGAAPDTVDLTGVGLGADFTALQTITVAAGSASDATLLAGTITTTGDQAYGTGVTLGGPTTLTANGIHFSAAVSALATQALTLSTTQDIAFDAAVGSAGAPLGAIHITGARNVTAASIDAASFTQAAGTGTTTLGGALDTTAAEGVSIDTATIDVNAAITSHDQAISLTAATALAITAAQNLSAASATFTTDNLSLSADLSGTGNLTFQPVAAGDNVDLGGAGSGLSLTNAALAHLVDGFASLTFGRTDGTGLLTVQPGVSSFNDPVVLRMPAAGGALHINGDLVGAGNASFTLDGSGGTTTLNADIVTAGTPIAIHDSVVLGAAATVMLDTTDGGAVAGGANISFDTPGTINDDGTATALVLNAGTAGAITLAGAVGGTPLGSLTATAAAVNFNGGSVATTNDQTYNGQVVLGADAMLTSNAGKITFNGSVDAALATAAGLETHATTGGTFFNQPVGTGLNATNAAGLTFLRAFGPTTLNLDGKLVAANDETFHQAVTLQSDAQLVAGSVVFASTVDGAENLHISTSTQTSFGGAVGASVGGALTSLTIDGAGATDLNGGTIKTSGDQNYGQAEQLTGDATLVGANVTFANTVDGNFALHVTSSGTTKFENTVGGLATGLASLTLDGAGTTVLGGDTIKTSGDQLFNQAVRLTNNADLAGISVTFASTIDGAFALHVTSSGTTKFENTVGVTLPGLASLTLDGGGLTDLDSGAVHTSGDQSYGQAVQLTAGADLTGANVTFVNTVDGAFALHVTTTGSTKFEQAVGGGTPLASLTLDGAGTSDLNGGTINTVGDQAYDQPVQLSSDANLAGANVTFANTVNGAFALTVTTTGITKFEQAVGATLPSLTKLTLDGAGTTVLAGDTIKTTGDQLFNQAVRLANNADLSGANVTFANTIDGAFSLHVTSSGVTKFANTVGVTLPGLASLTLDGTGTTDLNGGAINTGGDQSYDQPVQVTSDATLVGANVTFASTVNGAFALHVTTTGSTTFEQAVGATLPRLTKLTLDGAGTTVLGGDTINTSGDQLYNQAVRLTNKADLSGVNVTFASTIDGAFALHVTSSGTTKFENTVGVTLPGLASLTLDGAGLTDLNGGAINTSGDQTYDQPVQLTSDATLAGANVTFAGTVNGAFALHVTTSGSTTFEQAVGATLPSLTKLTLDGAGATVLGGDTIKTSGDQLYNQAVRLTNNADLSGANVTFANTIDGAFALHVTTSGTTTFEDTVGVTLPGLASLSLDGAGTTDLIGDAINTSGDQTYHQAVVLSAKADLKGANVTFANTIGGAFALHVTTSGTTKFENTLGVTLPGLVSLTLDGTGTTDLNGGAINTSGDQTYDQPVQLTSDATLVGANVTFASTVNGAFALHATTTGITKFENTVGGGSPLASLTLGGAGTTDLNGGAVTTSGNQTYNQAVVLTSDATLTAANAAFNNTVDGDGLGPWNLTASVTGSAAFGDGTGYDAVGAAHALKTLTVNGASLFNIAASAANHPSVTTVGSQTYNGPVRLAADAVLLTQTDNSGIAFASTIDDAPLAHAALTADTTNGRTGANFGTVQFGGDMGATNPLSALTVNTGGVSGAFALNHAIDATGDVAITVFESVAGAANDNLTLDSSITSTGGNVLLRAGDNLTVAHGASIHAAAGSVTLAGDFNNNDPTAGTAMSIDGLIVSPTVSLTSGSGNDTIGLVGEIDATSLSISSGSGSDTIDVNGTITSGAVNIDAGSGNDTINLRGTTNSPSVTVTAGDGDDIVNVLKTMPGTTTINTGSGGDTVNVSSTAPSTGGTLTSITGLVAVHGDGADTLNVYDDGEAANVTGDLTSSTITGLGMGTGATHGIVYDGGLKTVNVALGSGSGLVFNVHSTPGVTAVNVTGQGAGAVNVGNNNQLKDVAGLLTVIHVHSLTLNDQNSGTGQSYDITGAAIGRPGVPPQVLVDYAQVAALALDTGDQTGGTLVDDAINLFLPRPGEAMLPALLQINGGDSPGGFHNRLYVVAPQDATSHNTKYTAHVGWFGSADPILVKNIQSMWMYGSPVDSNDLANDTLDTPAAGGQPAQSAVPSVIIGGANFDTLKGGGGQDVLFGGGTPASSSDPASLPGASPHVFPEQLSGGGVQNLAADKSNQDYVFGDFIPTYGADGKVTFSQVSANGNLMKIDAGGGTAVSLAPFTSLNNATTVSQINGIIDVVTWLKARFASANAAGSLITEALANDAVLANLAPPPVLPPTVPTTIPASILTPGAGAPLATDAQIHAYIDNVYNNVFGHAPDAAGLQYWSAVLDSAAGATPSNHASLGTISTVDWLTARTNFTRAVTHSDEYFGSVVIAKAYQDYLGRAPDAAGLAYWIDQMQNHGLTDERLEAGFIGSQEFYNKAGGTDNAWVDLMYQSLLGRSADAQGEAYWTNQLAQHVSRADIAAGFTASLERERQRVEQDYSTYLGRQPDPQGVDYWVTQFANGETNENVIAGFMASDEYFQKHSS